MLTTVNISVKPHHRHRDIETVISSHGKCAKNFSYFQKWFQPKFLTSGIQSINTVHYNYLYLDFWWLSTFNIRNLSFTQLLIVFGWTDHSSSCDVNMKDKPSSEKQVTVVSTHKSFLFQYNSLGLLCAPVSCVQLNQVFRKLKDN